MCELTELVSRSVKVWNTLAQHHSCLQGNFRRYTMGYIIISQNSYSFPTACANVIEYFQLHSDPVDSYYYKGFCASVQTAKTPVDHNTNHAVAEFKSALHLSQFSHTETTA